MNMISRTALSNFRKNKSRNLLIGAAIALTTFLLTAAPTAIFGFVTIQSEAVNRYYPTFHAMFRNADRQTAQKLLEDARVEQAGLREDVAAMYCDQNSDIRIAMLYIDQEAAELSRQELSEGRFPEKADEIVVSKGILEAMGLKGAVGERILIPFRPDTESGTRESREFTIVGMFEDSEISVREKMYFSFVSDAFSREMLEADEHRYRIYLRLAGTEGMLTDGIGERVELLGGEYGITKRDIDLNREYLFANYVDPALYSGLGMVLAMIALAGALTIYGIYYVSMLDKVQEYGRLRAVGATKRQIRQLVFREGLAVAAFAIPLGILPGLAAGVQMIRVSARYSVSSDPALAEQMKWIAESGEVNLIRPWIIGFGILISLATVSISLQKPMRTAAGISAIEALRYQGNEHNAAAARKRISRLWHRRRKPAQTSGKCRKGYEEINTRKLTITNLTRNKKRTVMTIFTLGATGILFMVVAALCSCMDPEDMARARLREDIRVSVDSWSHPMYPERALNRIQQNNPMTEELKEQILRIDGVTDIDVDRAVSVRLEGPVEDDGSPLQSDITGISSKALAALSDYVAEGSLEDPSLAEGNGIILGERFRDRFEEMKDWKPGKTIRMEILDGENILSKEFRIAAVTNGPTSLGGTWLAMPADALQSICETDLTDCFEITVESGMEQTAEEAVRQLIGNLEYVEMDTYTQDYEEAGRTIGMVLYICYGMLLIFGLIGILNLINTMINSVYVRRRELGMLQAIGMSGRQTVNMLQMEGLFYTLGTLALSLGIGSLLGYAAFLWARETGMWSIMNYRYPVVPAVVLTLAVLAVQLLVTYLVDHSFKKQSLIDRIRFSE
ncbi:MAG: FtsX-like permease family protein [Ruminococcus sp.]|uniref:FtsX-like permease family protein n=1 Tax=Schaedlerella arabinosiphila TaxID=2044587 RepID=A0A426DNP8_9FIRM|nr:FtsX-like permease family protein [Schaedlerella arabinosiphila]MCI8723814.1 FtsX-like permease family protein [Ruminococcus sp.]RRK34417.1 FtsX-like permease family protein [Schaedlerella arabinosiphila]